MGIVEAAVAGQAHDADRLRALLNAVAQQEPRLRWIVGERSGGTIVVATDLACGWVPPNVAIPVGLTLLPPQSRRGSLNHLIGATVASCTHLPSGNPPTMDAVATSIRARDLPEVAEPAWQLADATRWRDGLPRLAHTLALAGSSKSGVLESEIDELRSHLESARHTVLAGYPNLIDQTALGNWQLLAAIDALVTGQPTAMNYHLSWFQCLHRSPIGQP